MGETDHGAGAGPLTATFLFTDIEGSTRLLQELGDRGPAVIGRHHEILGEVIAGNAGIVRRTEGDSFFATFDDATKAVEAAVALQLAIARESWPTADGLRVRVGLHSGDAVIVGQDEFVGLAVHRAARVMSIGWGEQILLSGTTAALLREDRGFELRDLGEHQLKDLAQPERIHQVVAEGLRAAFPPVRSIDRVRHNLPTQLTSFIGRRSQVAEVVQMLDAARLLTLTGPGGTGKTRLSIEVATEVADQFADGVFFVELAPVTDPQLVMSRVAEVIGLAASGSRTPLEVIQEHLQGRHVLLVLDNCEQVLDAGIELGKLLSAAATIRVLATSRAPLRITGEREFPVPPLPLPVGPMTDVSEVAGSEAAALFIERAVAIQPDFVLTAQNAPAVGQITRRLEGMPLAIELAAARLRLLSVEAIASRLTNALDLLSSGDRDRTERQRSLRGAIAWSHDLLDEAGRLLFARMSIFRGGADLEHVETICGPGLGDDVFDVLSALVDHSLVRRVDADTGSRFVMLETIREFAADQLMQSGEEGVLLTRHAAVFLAMAQQAAPLLTGADRGPHLDRLEADHDNLRAVLRRSMRAGDTQTSLQLGAAIWRLWQIRGHLHEARRNLEAVVVLPGADAFPLDLTAAREAAGGVAYWQGDLSGARVHYAAALEICEQIGDPEPIARGLYNLAFSYGYEDPEEAHAYFDRALEAYEALGDVEGIARTHWGLAVGSYWLKDFAAVGRHTDACIDVFRSTGQSFDLAWALHMKGLSELGLGRFDSGRPYLEEALQMFVASDDVTGFHLALSDFALLAEARGDHARALRVWGAVERLGEETGAGLEGQQRELIERPVRSEDQFDAATVAALKAEGRAMTRQQAISHALGEDD